MTVTYRFVPASLDHPRRIAKLLNRYYEESPLANCQNILAVAYGFQDWFQLCQVVTKRTEPPSPFDEDVDDEVLQARWRHQVEVFAREFGTADDQISVPPEPTDPLARMMEDSWSRATRRGARAAPYYDLALAEAVTLELCPSGRTREKPAEWSPPEGAEYPHERPDLLPRTIAGWWRKNISHQPEVAAAIEQSSLNPNSAVDILQFGHYWGILSHHYADSIPTRLMIGVTWVLAEHYATIQLSLDPHAQELIAIAGPDFSARTHGRTLEELNEISSCYVVEYLRTQMRDDLTHIFVAQPAALSTHLQADLRPLRRYMPELAKPEPKPRKARNPHSTGQHEEN